VSSLKIEQKRKKAIKLTFSYEIARKVSINDIYY